MSEILFYHTKMLLTHLSGAAILTWAYYFLHLKKVMRSHEVRIWWCFLVAFIGSIGGGTLHVVFTAVSGRIHPIIFILGGAGVALLIYHASRQILHKEDF
ncbi:hypothetical protein STHERM_c10920 [Spirochaeta thermophila DSM 6192]|uniref:DUF2306 domain-containing protein n=2 Tax=Winmispira thermophila TaxID=154 RepID=E0RSQ0_WINT6|nr:hypothetical protein STHERM_c10920 [Spirochaeta thermophila DSM 6192]